MEKLTENEFKTELLALIEKGPDPKRSYALLVELLGVTAKLFPGTRPFMREAGEWLIEEVDKLDAQN